MAKGTVYISEGGNHQIYIADLVLDMDQDMLVISDTLDEGEFWQAVNHLDLNVVELYS